MKPCPYCGSEIQDAAIKCRYCAMMLTPEAIAKHPPTQAITQPPAAPARPHPAANVLTGGAVQVSTLGAGPAAAMAAQTSVPASSPGHAIGFAPTLVARVVPAKPSVQELDKPSEIAPRHEVPQSPRSEAPLPVVLPTTAGPSFGGEYVFFSEGGVKITNTRAMFPQVTYAMANVTSVSRGHEQFPPRRLWPIATVIVGALCFASGLSGHTETGPMILGTLLVAAGVFWFRKQRTKHLYWVNIGSASGEAKALPTPDGEWVARVVQAMNEAFIKRG